MSTEKIDWSALVAALNQLLRLRTTPIGMFCITPLSSRVARPESRPWAQLFIR